MVSKTVRNLYCFGNGYYSVGITYTLVNWDNLPCFIPVTILWYAYEDMEYIDGVQKRLNTLIFDYNGGQFKMSMRDFLRSGPDYIDYPWIYWDDPKTSNGISDESWNMIQQELFWIGMPKNEFLLMKGLDPKSINSYNYGYGTTEQWVYSSGYYYFRDGVLTSWQVF